MSRSNRRRTGSATSRRFEPTDDLFRPRNHCVFKLIGALGMWMSLVFHMLKEGTKGGSPIQRALWFGGIGIGINWLLYNLFVLLFVDLPILNPIILAFCNILPVIAAVFGVERYVLKIDTCAVDTKEQPGLTAIDC